MNGVRIRQSGVTIPDDNESGYMEIPVEDEAVEYLRELEQEKKNEACC